MANNLDILRAKYAFNMVAKVSENNSDFQNNFKSYVKNVPMLIKTNGIAATFAFVKSKSKNENNEYNIIYDLVDIWLRTEMKNPIIQENSHTELSKALIDMSPSDFKRATKEVLALFVWLKRFAEGNLMKKRESETKNTQGQ